MNEKMLIDNLMNFGLTHNEAIIYVSLIKNGAQTGYEVSKNVGISKSNTYAGLSGLVDKGAANVMESAATMYVPVSFKEFTDNVIHALKHVQKELVANQPVKLAKSEGYITIAGFDHISDKIRTMILGAGSRIYLVMSSENLADYLDEIAQAAAKKRKIVILSDKEMQIPGCTVYKMEHMEGQVRLIVDSNEVITGTFLEGTGEPAFLYSGNRNLIEVFMEMLRGEIIYLEDKYHVKKSVLVVMKKDI